MSYFNCHLSVAAMRLLVLAIAIFSKSRRDDIFIENYST